MRELVLHCPGEHTDALTDALIEAGALCASVEDADLDTPQEQPLFGEPGSEPSPQAWHHSKVMALLPDGADPSQIVEQARARIAQPVGEPWQVRDVPDQDWVRLTQSQFGPIEVGERLLIVPTWHREALVPAGRVAIELDPGLAFGTGSHPTTHLCLQWLAQQMPAQARVLDYGCGSGILAIAARLLGAGAVVGVDIDEQAVESTRQNAAANRVDVQAVLPEGLAPGVFDVVLANILSNPLKVLAPMLSARVRPAGHLVLSGVLSRQAQEVMSFYAPWIDMAVWAERDGWACLAGRRREVA